jgi:hypothetical protein
VVGQKGIVRLIARGERAIARVSTLLAEASVPTRDLDATPRDGQLEASMIVATALTPDWDAVRVRLAEELGDSVLTTDGLATASVVGIDASAVETALAATKTAGATPLAVVASGSRVSVLTDEAMLDALVRELHARFVA